MKLCNLYKFYYTKNASLHVLKDINVNFEKNKFYAIMGRSGSGKSTLVNILGLLDNFTSGSFELKGINVSQMSEKEKTVFRGNHIGFVFQSFYLNKNLTALENVMLPLFIHKEISEKDRINKAVLLLNKLGLKDRMNHKPSQLSGGEQQRVAIARALINNPSIIIADEPTGNLDSKNEKEVFNIFKNISTDDKTVIVVSHNPIIKDYCDELFLLDDGVLKKGEL